MNKIFRQLAKDNTQYSTKTRGRSVTFVVVEAMLGATLAGLVYLFLGENKSIYVGRKLLS